MVILMMINSRLKCPDEPSCAPNFASRRRDEHSYSNEMRTNFSAPRTKAFDYSNDEYYNTITSMVNDANAVEEIRLRRVLQEYIKACEKEIQEDVKKLLKDEAEPTAGWVKSDYTGKDVFMKDRINRNNKSDDMKDATASNKISQAKNFIPGRRVLARAQQRQQAKLNKERIVWRSNDKSCDDMQPLDCSDPGHVDMSTLFSANDNEVSHEVILKKVKQKFPSLTKETKCKEINEKYFPCAVQLAEPNREKTIVFCDLEVQPAPVLVPAVPATKGSNNTEKTTNPKVMDQSSPVIQADRQFESMHMNDSEHTSTHNEENNIITAQVLRREYKKNLHDEKKVEDDDEMTSADLEPRAAPTMQDIDNSMINSHSLSEILASLWKQHQTILSENKKVGDKFSTQRVSEEHENSSNFTDVKAPLKSISETMDFTDGDSNNTLSMASKCIQTSSATVLTFEKLQQTDQICTVECCTQTELSSHLDHELVFKSTEKETRFEEEIPPEAVDKSMQVSPSTSAFDVQTEILEGTSASKNMTTSTPKKISNKTSCSEVQSEEVCPDLISFEEVKKEYEDRGTGSFCIAMKDIGIQPVIETESQTLPEMKNVCLQAKYCSDLVSTHTMTKSPKVLDAFVQVQSDVVPQPIVTKYLVDRGTQIKHMLSRNSSSADSPVNVTFSSDDLFSEGEVRLFPHRHFVRFDQTGDHSNRKNPYSYKKDDECLLSEGEIPPALLKYFPGFSTHPSGDLLSEESRSRAIPNVPISMNSSSLSRNMSDGEVIDCLSNSSYERCCSVEPLQPVSTPLQSNNGNKIAAYIAKLQQERAKEVQLRNSIERNLAFVTATKTDGETKNLKDDSFYDKLSQFLSGPSKPSAKVFSAPTGNSCATNRNMINKESMSQKITSQEVPKSRQFVENLIVATRSSDSIFGAPTDKAQSSSMINDNLYKFFDNEIIK